MQAYNWLSKATSALSMAMAEMAHRFAAGSNGQARIAPLCCQKFDHGAGKHLLSTPARPHAQASASLQMPPADPSRLRTCSGSGDTHCT